MVESPADQCVQRPDAKNRDKLLDVLWDKWKIENANIFAFTRNAVLAHAAILAVQLRVLQEADDLGGGVVTLAGLLLLTSVAIKLASLIAIRAARRVRNAFNDDIAGLLRDQEVQIHDPQRWHMGSAASGKSSAAMLYFGLLWALVILDIVTFVVFLVVSDGV